MLSLSNPSSNNQRGNRKSRNGSRRVQANINRGIFPRNEGDIYFKRCTVPNLTYASTATGNFDVAFIGSGRVQTQPATEFTALATRYQEYRVRAVRVHGFALYPVNTDIIEHTTISRSSQLGNNIPASFAQNVASESCKVCPTYACWTSTLTWNVNPNAKLWTNTTASIPSENQYALAICGNQGFPVNESLIYYTLYVEWDVEFRGSQ